MDYLDISMLETFDSLKKYYQSESQIKMDTSMRPGLTSIGEETQKVQIKETQVDSQLSLREAEERHKYE